MAYRTIDVRFKPRNRAQWNSHSASRREAARLWNDLVEIHFRIRRRGLKWPSKARFFKWAKGRYPSLSAQSVQQIIGEFCEAVNSARQLRKNGFEDAKFPWKKSCYRDVVYTNQDARLRNGCVVLPNGISGWLTLRLPRGFILPGRLMEVRLAFDTLLFVCHIPDEARGSGPTIGVDLGVNTLVAATDGETAVLVSGRQVKAIIQGRNKALAGFQRAQSRKIKGSRRWQKLQRRKKCMLARANRRVKDACHKATRQVANAFPHARVYVGRPFNDAAQKIGCRQAQIVSQACNARIVAMLDYKTAGAIQASEAFSSQTCPVCGERRKCRRTYTCQCGVEAPRDVIGAVNIKSIGVHGEIQTGQTLPSTIKYLRPLGRSSSSGHPASRSLLARSPRL